MSTTIAVLSQKGGTGKTTAVRTLSDVFARVGLDTLAVDLDPQGNLSMSQGIDVEALERSTFDVLVHKQPLEEIVHHKEFDVAPASIDLAGAELQLGSMIGRERALEKALLAVRGDYDFILIDTPPSLGLLTINSLTAADGVIVPVQCEYLSLRGLIQLENTLAMIREHLNPRVRIVGILPTMYDGRTIHGREAVEILRETYGELVFDTMVRKAVRFAEAPVRGQSVISYDSRSTAADTYRRLADEVLASPRVMAHAT